MKGSLKNRIGWCLCTVAFFYVIQFHPAVKKGIKIRDAIKNGNIDTIERILKSESPIDEGKHLSIPYLLEAVDNNKIDIVKLFIKYGADVNVTGFREDSTPLHLAAIRGYEDIVKILIDNGAKIDMRNRMEETPLMYAAQKGHYNVAELLIQNGADINAKRCGYRIENALTFAVQSLKFDIVKLLVDHNVRYNKKYISRLKENRKKMAFKYHGNKNFNKEFMKIVFYLEENIPPNG